MRREVPTLAALLIAAAALASGARPATGQEAPVIPDPLEIGAVAPDFAIPGATRHGILAEPVTLKEYAGKTVVLSFFFRARTRG